MTTVLLVGAGAVGARAGRQLVDTPGIDRVLVADRSRDAAEELVDTLGASAEAIPPPATIDPDVAAVALAIPGEATPAFARAAVAAGRPVAAVADEEAPIANLLGLDADARSAGSAVVVGCTLAPGLADVLARHTANSLDEADEAHVARVGAAGDACVAALRRIRRERPLEWRDGGWRSERRLGAQLVWFPDPVGARECESVAPGVALLRDAVPTVQHATVRAAEPPVRRPSVALVTRKALDDGWGGARVEVWGWRGGTRQAVVYGVIERPAVAAGTVLAVTAARLAGALPELELETEAVGALGLGALVQPASFLAELARRGVKAAAFEGVALS